MDNVDFTISGPVRFNALIGENGAGKSTLVKIMTGDLSAYERVEILMDGKPVQFRTSHDAQAAGVVAIHQEASMFSELTVTENIFMGHHIRRKNRFGTLGWKAMKKHTQRTAGPAGTGYQSGYPDKKPGNRPAAYG